MTEIFNNAYNQANQILDGSGLSSVIHKQEGGSFNTYDRALEAWKKDATRGIDDMAIDPTAAFKHGGKITSGGLAEITKSININGQPHKLAWINSDEASALKAMGGSGKKVGGIPAYYEGDMVDWAISDAASSPGVEDYGYHSDADVGYSEADSASGSAQAAAGEGYMGTGEDVASVSSYVDASTDTPGTRGPEDYSWNWMPSGKTWRYDYSTDPRAEGPGPGYGDFVPLSAVTPETKAYFDKRAKDLARDATILDVDDYKAQVIAFAQHRYNKNAQMKHMFDREAPKVLDQMAEEYDLPLWGIGLRSMDDLGAGEPLHYWQYSGYTDKDGNKIPGAIELAHEGYYGGKDSGFLSGLASLLGNLLIPGVPVIDSLAKTTRKGFGKANPNDPRYWPKHERSYTDALQAVRNEYSDKKKGIEEGFGASLKELWEMYKLGSDDTTTKVVDAKPGRGEGDASADMVDWAIAQMAKTEPEAKKDREGTYDDFWKDPSEELYQGNYEEYPQKPTELPKLKEDLTEKEKDKKEKRPIADLVNLEGDLVERLSLQKVAKLLKDIYGEDYTPFGGTA